jgi:dihydrofolate synthase/folylpolyglutamate synthase
MFSRIGAAAYKKDLDNTLRLCAALDNPQQKFKTIHVAGTNGKGSVSHMLAAILQTAGYKVGLYTSPHLKDFRERIKVNGELCSQSFVVAFTQKIMPLIDELAPSFFEITVAMAFDYFAKEKVDIAVIEVGLGGRLDSTNVIIPELSIITNIGWDHMNILGDTLEKIAFEKAGIIKKNVPLIIGEKKEPSYPVFEQVFNGLSNDSSTAPLIYAEEQFYIAGWEYQQSHLIVEVVDTALSGHHTYTLDLSGIYQIKNLLTVLAAAKQLHLQGWRIDVKTVQAALPHSKKLSGLHGRWETIHQNPKVILDVAHNIDGMQQLNEQLALTDHHQLHIVIGMVKDKDIDAVLALLPKQARYYFTQAQIPRAMEASVLQEKAADFHLKGHHFAEVNIALQDAIGHAAPNDLILVCGSVFLVGEVNLF